MRSYKVERKEDEDQKVFIHILLFFYYTSLKNKEKIDNNQDHVLRSVMIIIFYI